MNLIDEQGRIFGLVNVIDALAVLLVAAVLTAGAALVFAPEPAPTEPATTIATATIDLGPQPEYIVRAIQQGDTFSPTGHSTLTITDIHLSPRDGRAHVLLGVELKGVKRGNSLHYDGAPTRLGRTLKIVTDTYEVAGTLVNVGNTPSRSTVRVLVTGDVSTETANAIEQGDTYQIAERTLGTVRTIAVYGTASPDRKRVFVGLELNARAQGDEHTFAGTPIREGARIPFITEDYRLNARIQRTGSLEQRGTQTTNTVTLQLKDVPPAIANGIQAGMTESAAGATSAEIISVERSNATVILTSQDGQIYERDHPRNQDLTITADLHVRETASGMTFKGHPIQQGSRIVLDLGRITIRATVVSL